MRQLLTIAVLLLASLTGAHCASESAPVAPPIKPTEPAKAMAVKATEPKASPRALRNTMTATERRAIEEAQARRAPTLPSRASETIAKDALGSTVIGTQKATPEEPGLTQIERRAAMDDPAVNLPQEDGAEGPVTATETDVASKRPVTTPRPGVELRSGVDGLKLVDLAIATDVKRREPTGIDNRFATLPARFHCFCVFENRQQATQVTHVWKRDGRVVSRVELEVGKSPKWRTWSRQRLQPTWTGNWTCEVVSSSGRILGSASVQAGD